MPRYRTWGELHAEYQDALRREVHGEAASLRRAMDAQNDWDYPSSRDAGSAVTRAEASMREATRRGLL